MGMLVEFSIKGACSVIKNWQHEMMMMMMNVSLRGRKTHNFQVHFECNKCSAFTPLIIHNGDMKALSLAGNSCYFKFIRKFTKFPQGHLFYILYLYIYTLHPCRRNNESC